MKVTLLALNIIAFSFLPLICIAQADFRPGYIIKDNGDSINGFVSYGSGKKNTERCFYKETKKSKYTSFTPEEVNGYGFLNDKQFESWGLPAELKSANPAADSKPRGKVFMKVLAKGPISLYRYGKYYLLHKNGLIILPYPENKLIETNQGSMLQNDHRYIDILNTFLEGSKLTANRTGYDESELTQLIKNYNRFKGYEPLPKNQKPSVKLHFAIFSGYMQSKMKMDWPDVVSFSPSSTIIGGIGLDISAPRTNDRLSLSLEGWYAKIFYQGYSERSVSGDLFRQDTFVDASFFKVPVGVRYNLLGQTNTPYIKLGLSLYFIGSPSIRILEEVEKAGNVIITEENFGEDFRIKNQRGIWFSVGYERNIFHNLNMFAEFRLEKNNGFIGSAVQSFSSSVDYTFLLGIKL